MKRLLMTVAVAALAVPAIAQETTTEAPAEQVVDDTAQAADATVDAAGEAADATGDAMAEPAADAVAEPAADDMAEPATDAAAEPASDGMAADMMEPAEGEMAAEGEMIVDELVVAPDVNAPSISAEEPGMLASWISGLDIYTTTQSSDTEWVPVEGDVRPEEWQRIAGVKDIVLDENSNVVGYIADIGGFLGIGAKEVLLGTDAIHLSHFGSDSVFATNYTKEELEALPDFDMATVLPVPAEPAAPDAAAVDPAAEPTAEGEVSQ